ncbi:MAG: cation:proton antiporter, partial [Chloroflexota bacterium]|nr:cation:proton antiporter [Chloroflexota bacterium]
MTSRLPPAAVRMLVLVVGVAGLLAGSQYFRTSNEAESGFGSLMAAIAIIIVFGRALGVVLARLGQPRVMGEVVAGILLGPTLVGGLPELLSELFHVGVAERPEFVDHLNASLSGVADVGLVFYMFLVGLELDPAMLGGRVRQAVAISGSSVVLPFALGILTALLFIPPALAGPGGISVPFAIFMGVAMSITAFPVLARILVERRMLRHPVGALALASAAVDDVLAWSLLAAVVAMVSGVAQWQLALTLPYLVLMFAVVRPLLRRLVGANTLSR